MTETKSILMTGCSSGIGYHAAHFLKARGWRVFATCRSSADAARLRNAGLESWALDYSDDVSVAEGAERALDLTEGKLFALFNNGAFATPGAVEDIPRDAWRAIFETNLFGYIDLTNRVLPAMRSTGRGRIINNSSVLGFAALPYRGAYNATKFALEGMTDTMRVENLNDDVHFVLIEPGPVRSSIRQKSIPHFERWVKTEGTAHESRYRNRVIPRLYDDSGTPDRFQLEPDAVSHKLLHALTAKNPRPRYYVTRATYIMGILKRVLTTRALDTVARKL